MSDDSFLGIDATTQTAAIAAAGVLLAIAGQATSSRVDPGYDPTVFGIGVVLVLYAVGRFIRERLGG